MATTAQAQERSGGIGCLGVILFVAVCLIALAVLLSGLPALDADSHAVQKHGQQAVDAYQYVDSLPATIKSFCKWQCPDGRTRYVCNVRGTDQWAVVILEGTTLVSSFISDHDYATHIIEDQCGGNHWAHP